MERKVIRIIRVDPASLMAFGFCFSVVIGPIWILLAVMHWIPVSPSINWNPASFGSDILWYLCFVFCMTFGNLLLGWLLDLALAWCKGINVEAMDEGPVVK